MRKQLTVEELAAGVLANSRPVVAKAITLVESSRPVDRDRARDLLLRLRDDTGHSVRVGISGVPGAGKSTFIDAIGRRLIERGHKVAVLAVDPSSSRT
ncbi:MAG TPA: methylmalonyl Co-A mutase-associated GTPase MeaB, partial [Propionibacteriaceae bacterium]|nr:methylmalonyl Co-A mutase-associated GTPase MeaB [Propionibacteriaceae bacterium]